MFYQLNSKYKNNYMDCTKIDNGSDLVRKSHLADLCSKQIILSQLFGRMTLGDVVAVGESNCLETLNQ